MHSNNGCIVSSYCYRSKSIHLVDLGNVCQMLKLGRYGLLELDVKKVINKAVDYHDVLC